MEEQPKQDKIERTNLNCVCSILLLLGSVGISALMASHKVFKTEQYCEITS